MSYMHDLWFSHHFVNLDQINHLGKTLNVCCLCMDNTREFNCFLCSIGKITNKDYWRAVLADLHYKSVPGTLGTVNLLAKWFALWARGTSIQVFDSCKCKFEHSARCLVLWQHDFQIICICKQTKRLVRALVLWCHMVHALLASALDLASASLR